MDRVPLRCAMVLKLPVGELMPGMCLLPSPPLVDDGEILRHCITTSRSILTSAMSTSSMRLDERMKCQVWCLPFLNGPKDLQDSHPCPMDDHDNFASPVDFTTGSMQGTCSEGHGGRAARLAPWPIKARDGERIQPAASSLPGAVASRL
jgi:hypothetical protein